MPDSTQVTPVSLTINGRTVRAAPGTTLLQAARSAGIDIPTLCFHPT
jgi:NADH dehydrogenase/NADH:ubiquinone oxidoreductase subunit G